jgi:hypothetical protein
LQPAAAWADVAVTAPIPVTASRLADSNAAAFVR